MLLILNYCQKASYLCHQKDFFSFSSSFCSLFRLLYSCLGYKAGQSAWINAIKHQENEILEQIKFIMTSSTNGKIHFSER